MPSNTCVVCGEKTPWICEVCGERICSAHSPHIHSDDLETVSDDGVADAVNDGETPSGVYYEP